MRLAQLGARRTDSDAMLKVLWSGLCGLLAPEHCAACDALLYAEGDGFCAACGLLLELEPVNAHGDVHDRSACRYGGPLGDALKRFKYRGETASCTALVGLLLPHVVPMQGRVDLVTCIPLHPRRLAERGFNQSALLARPVARQLSARFSPTFLRRLRDVPHQVGLTRGQRLELARGSLLARRRLNGEGVLVVDDVRTTGATLAAAREALLAAGASTVYTLTVAQTDTDA